MTTRLLTWFCVAAAATLAASVALVEESAPDEDDHLAFSRLLEERRSLDQDVVRHALEARFQFAANYDQLAKDEVDGRSLQGVTLPAVPHFLRASERDEIQQAFARYALLTRERQRLLEHFKSRNALLKNSVSYFPNLTTLVSNQAQSGELLRSIGALSNTTLSLALRSDASLVDAQRRAREELTRLARPPLASPDVHNLQLLLGHARTIAEQKSETDATLSAILILPIGQRQTVLDAAYQRAYVRASHQARWLGHFVSALAVTLLALLTYVGIRLRRAAKALARSHDRLELAVAERTAELSEEMRSRQRIEIELRQAQKLEAVGQLAAGIAHEINTPIQYVGDSVYFLREAFGDLLRVVEGYQEFLLAPVAVDGHQLLAEARRLEEDVDLAGLKSEIPAAFERALDGARQVTSIVQAMKTFSHSSPDKAPLDLNQAIENTLTVARNEYRFVADLATELGMIPEVVCNAAAIRQVLLNLIVNASHAIGDVVVKSGDRGRITIRTEHHADTVTIAVTDTGTGIPEEVRDRIFDPFFTTKPPGKGSGQGLAISRSIVDQHGGKLSFRTTVGQGTTFLVELPVEARERHAPPGAPQAA